MFIIDNGCFGFLVCFVLVFFYWFYWVLCKKIEILLVRYVLFCDILICRDKDFVIVV